MKSIFTVCNETELAQAITLGVSVKKFHPDSLFFIGWVGDTPPPRLPENMLVIPVHQLGLDQWTQMTEHYSTYELVIACRPWFANYILEQNPQVKQLTFLAPTVFLYQSLDSVDSTSDLLLTPNILKPLPESELLDDKRILNIGMFNSGSWLLKRSTETTFFLNWWSERTIDRAKLDLCNGMCMDQLWLNYAPVWVKNTSHITSHGWHLGLHSLLNSSLEIENNTCLVNGTSLVSVDFAGLTSYHPVWSDHAELANQFPIFKQLLKNYSQLSREYVSYVNETSKIPGTAHKRSISKSRKNVIGRLKSITKFIDRYEWQNPLSN